MQCSGEVGWLLANLAIPVIYPYAMSWPIVRLAWPCTKTRVLHSKEHRLPHLKASSLSALSGPVQEQIKMLFANYHWISQFGRQPCFGR